MPTGKTRDAGWQIGVSRTLPYRVEEVWDLLTSTRGVTIWLGRGVTLPRDKGAGFRSAEGIEGELRSFHYHDRIRLTWHPTNWDHESTVQIAVQEKGAKTLLRFHQERLGSSAERERQRRHWQRVLGDLEEALASGDGREG